MNGGDDLSSRLAREREARAVAQHALQRMQAQIDSLQAALARTQAAELRARHLSCHDALTSLPNFRYLKARLENSFAQPGPTHKGLAVFFVDLDGFKQINDLHGHGVGNALLQITAARMRCAVRAQDLVGRVGGDEFACIIEGLPGRTQIRHIACKLFGSIHAPMLIGDRAFRVRPSIGIALFPGDASTPAALLDQADAAMYAAKRQRTGYSFFDNMPPDVSSATQAPVHSSAS
jgi:diguanylate cyclase